MRTAATLSAMAGTGGREAIADVRLERVRKRFGDVVAVDDITLRVAPGEFFSLLGPSGCGKTTTLRMIGGFEQPDAGTIELGGVDVSGLPPHRRDVNTVFQSYALFPHLDVFENVAYGLRRKNTEKSEIRRRVVDILEVVNLPGFERRRPSQLSGGQQQRVALARALVNRPKLLLLDEPLGALDLKLRKQMQLELKRIQNDVGITFIYVTHDQEEAMTMSDRIAVMRDGRIEQIGAPEETYERPATAFVADFLGASNLLDATVGNEEGEARVLALASGEKIRVPAETLDGREGAVRVGVRPEKISLRAPDTGTSEDNAIDGRVLDATFVGVSNVYTVETRSRQRVTVYVQNLGTARGWSPGPGEPVVLSWHPEHTFVVEARDGGGDGGKD